MVSSTLCPAVHILGSQNVYGRAEGIAGHYWPWAVFLSFSPSRRSSCIAEFFDCFLFLFVGQSVALFACVLQRASSGLARCVMKATGPTEWEQGMRCDCKVGYRRDCFLIVVGIERKKVKKEKKERKKEKNKVNRPKSRALSYFNYFLKEITVLKWWMSENAQNISFSSFIYTLDIHITHIHITHISWHYLSLSLPRWLSSHNPNIESLMHDASFLSPSLWDKRLRLLILLSLRVEVLNQKVRWGGG